MPALKPNNLSSIPMVEVENLLTPTSTSMLWPTTTLINRQINKGNKSCFFFFFFQTESKLGQPALYSKF